MCIRPHTYIYHIIYKGIVIRKYRNNGIYSKRPKAKERRCHKVLKEIRPVKLKFHVKGLFRFQYDNKIDDQQRRIDLKG